MQLRAGIVYIVLFLVITAGAYAVIATAEAPEVAIDEADADYQIEQGDDFTAGDLTYNVSELDGNAGTATLEHVNTEAVFDVTWSGASAADGDSWDAGDSVQLEEEGVEYYVYLYAPPEADEDEEEEPVPETILFVEEFDEDEFTPIERADGVYVTVDDDGDERVVHVNEVEEIDTFELELGDELTYFEPDQDGQVDGEIVEIDAESVTLEYVGEDVSTVSLEQNEVVLINGEEFGVHFPHPSYAYLTEDVESFEAQHAAVEEHHERVHGLWWVIGLSIVTVILLTGLAFMPVRG
ncbi:hypothetical protein ACLI4U_07595 [Natrialbaceae archaeon A-CW2]